MFELRAIKSQSARALEALILSNLRTNAVRYLHIDHLDLDGRADDPLRPGPKWTVPNDLMKVDDDGHPFILPMVQRLVDVLKEQIAYLEETFSGQPVGLLWPRRCQSAQKSVRAADLGKHHARSARGYAEEERDAARHARHLPDVGGK